MDDLIAVRKMPIGVQDVVVPVNCGKKKARKQDAPRRMGWGAQSRPGANAKEELYYPVPTDPVQHNFGT